MPTEDTSAARAVAREWARCSFCVRRLVEERRYLRHDRRRRFFVRRRTKLPVQAMCALVPLADMQTDKYNVRFVPAAELKAVYANLGCMR